MKLVLMSDETYEQLASGAVYPVLQDVQHLTGYPEYSHMSFVAGLIQGTVWRLQAGEPPIPLEMVPRWLPQPPNAKE